MPIEGHRQSSRCARIDVWTGNIGLHRYYEQRGFKHILNVDPATDIWSLVTQDSAVHQYDVSVLKV